MAFGDGFQIHKVRADAEGECAGLEEFGGSGLGDAAGGDHLDLRQGRFDRLEIFCAAEGAGWEYLDDLGWRERTGEDGDAVAVAHFDGFDVERGADYERGALEDAHAGGLGVEYGAGADEDVGAGFGEFA